VTPHTTNRAPKHGARVVNIRSKQPYDVYIGRPGPFGNPFKVGRDARDNAEAVELFRCWLSSDNPKAIAMCHRIDELKGKVLGCWCKPAPCHGDVLAEIANERSEWDAQEAVRL
jgi:hypothetical protein